MGAWCYPTGHARSPPAQPKALRRLDVRPYYTQINHWATRNCRRYGIIQAERSLDTICSQRTRSRQTKHSNENNSAIDGNCWELHLLPLISRYLTKVTGLLCESFARDRHRFHQKTSHWVNLVLIREVPPWSEVSIKNNSSSGFISAAWCR